MKPKILLADDLHFHKRGFKSLIEFIEKKELEHTFINHQQKEMLYKYGNYQSTQDNLQTYYDKLKDLSDDQLYDFRYSTFKVFPLVKAEILTYVMTFKSWYDSKISSDEKSIFKKLLKENKQILLENMSAALYWIDFWKKELENYSHYTHCCVFSGTLIYQKALIQIAQNSQLKVMLFEHFFTGNDYYCEHKYQHLPNNSDIKFKNYYQNILNTDHLDQTVLENEKTKAINKIITANNKNVKQPKESKKLTFKNENKTLLILGQVVNDFSVLETRLSNISTITFYKELISKTLENTNYNIIFKAHPWERKKANLNTPLTYNELNSFIEDTNYSNRVKIVEDHNLQTLFTQSDHIVTLCSQSAIEASFDGKKTVQFGEAFYGKKGFTHDLNSVDQFIENIDNLNTTLTLEEYKEFEMFLLKTLQLHLVSIHNSGLKTLDEKFKTTRTLSLATSTPTPNLDKLNIVAQNNTTIKSFLQKLKKVPFIGSSLLWFKHNILRWK
ncbi:MAG: capsule biosynthesis protein [Campylobacterota bacterium]|nr:capsule biosynthesis protein [Campylobacterota bacterium]